jgi:hypothetical protein
VVNRAERFPATVVMPGNEGILAPGFRRGEQRGEQVARHARQIAGNNQVPFGLGGRKGSFDTCEGSEAGLKIGQDGQSEVVETGRVANQSHGPCRDADFFRNPTGEGSTAERKQRFVLTHPAAAAPDQDVPGAAHETIVASVSGSPEPKSFGFMTKSRYNNRNKMLANCFQLFGMALFAFGVPASAADVRTTSVVRPDPKTGRLVRTVILSPRPVVSKIVAPKIVVSTPTGGKTGGDILQYIEETARANEVDPLLVHSVIQVESNYNEFALSPKGAQGMMQLIPATAQRFGVANSFDARENIAAGVKYLKYLQDMFKDDRLALAAYNAGEGAVMKYRDVPPYPETEQYVWQVGKKYGEARRKAGPPAGRTVPVAAAAPEVPPIHGLATYTDDEGRVHLRTR